MASALNPPRAPKPKCALPSHYHESFLEKKGPRDRDYRKFWAGLRGLTVYFYNSNRDSQHVEKIDLGASVKVTDGPGVHFNLFVRDQEIKFKVESLESREMWKGFILTVVELRVPSNLTLLPGHLYMMAEALAKEEARRAQEMPSCFLKVSRLEAQLLLERYPECGNLLLRPCGDGADGVSVSTRQTLGGSPLVRHYKVKRDGPQYVIDVEEPVSCASLQAVVNYFVSQTKNALVPFLLDEDYEKVLGYVEADKENGESVWVAPSVPAVLCPGAASLAGGPKQLPPVPVIPAPRQHTLPPLLNPDEDYVIPIKDAPVTDYENKDVLSPGWPEVRKPKQCPPAPRVQAKPHTAPKPEPRGLPSGLVKKPAIGSAQGVSATTGLAKVTAELEEKLQRRRALEHSAEHSED
ncbi:signal-transducing adaptor protein 2 isoform X1 [Pipistrellus kuhlii]|uniref:Signal transducing adaptor family member 2 n=1 Tax=Pipistrellus kuhlii TaxID=59472 RepID=A0A7J7TAP7_PIPKU|nr:signal-transducing adaptor protein 2 isoform X1 [Pipistrellus kuhlii]KAF6297774.1 signal transducing adaptor family member 2 [Pipistrellus kuhlii]